jgi:hydroxypyruvate reductase
MHHEPAKIRLFLKGLLDAALAAADPLRVVPPALPRRPPGMITVLGAGKAAAAMALAVERAWGPPMRGLVIVPDGHAMPCRHVEVVEAAHPVPDARGEAAARRLLAMARALGEDDFLLALISGGGSALMSLPLPGLAMADKQAVTRALLRCGASIHEINTVRRHLSAIKGGRLAAAAYPAPTLALIISDVPGDDPSVIASGPTVGGASHPREALAVLERWNIALPATVRACLRRQAEGGEDLPPAPDDIRLSRAEWRLIATPATSLKAARALALRHGLNVMNLGDRIEGEARTVARHHARLAGRIAGGAHAPGPPTLILSGGELTVRVRNPRGRGGPNGEYLLALALALRPWHSGGGRPLPRPFIAGLAADTDGRDGTEDNAGAFLLPQTLRACEKAGVHPLRALRENRSWDVFAAAGDLLVTGPTHTNVNDFRALLIL